MAVTIKDVAAKAGCSVTTVSRILNNRGSISEKTRKKVHTAMEELNYFPNQLAVNLFRQRTYLVGLIVPDVSHAFYALEIKYIERVLHENGYRLLLCNAESDNMRETEYLNMLQSNKVDGIIIASHTLDLEAYSKVNLPIVALDRFLGPDIPTVSSDHEQGGRLAAQELIDNNCKKVIQITGFCGVPTPSHKRHTVFSDVMKKNGICCETLELPFNAFSFRDYITYADNIFRNHNHIDGIFAADNVACAMEKVAISRGLNVPGDLKIVGYDGIEASLMSYKTLTTVAQPVKQLALTTVVTLLEMISGESVFDKGTHIRLPVRLIRGETTVDTKSGNEVLQQ